MKEVVSVLNSHSLQMGSSVILNPGNGNYSDVLPDLQAIRNATDIGELIGNIVKLRRMPGNTALGLCPFHNEKTPSLRVNLPGHRWAGRWHCHGCDAKGDVIDFIRLLDGLTLPEAVRRLAADAGIMLTDRPETPQERRQREADKLERSMAEWYWRERWKESRRGLDRAMRAIDRGNQFAEDLAGIYGGRLRWIERERGTAAGMAEFRARPRDAGELKRFREWKRLSKTGFSQMRCSCRLQQERVKFKKSNKLFRS